MIVAKHRELARRAADSAERTNEKETAAEYCLAIGIARNPESMQEDGEFAGHRNNGAHQLVRRLAAGRFGWPQ
jgi:hypothetical protein